jgi:4-amino-4-deoxy-L-arabinose transferase-like glycosyltransferase
MATTLPHIPEIPGASEEAVATSITHPAAPAITPGSRWRPSHILWIAGLWLAIFVASLWSPPLLDDADATHAQATQAMLATGDLVTLHVDGVRYLEKAPLPYWISAVSLRIFTSPRTLDRTAAFAMHLPLALTVLGLALLGYVWSRRAFGSHAAFYTAIFTLTAAGVFLFTRIFIPDALLSLLLAVSLCTMLRALDPANSHARLDANVMWIALALAVLTKGLVALVLYGGSAILFLFFTRSSHEASRWRRLAPVSGPLLFLAIAAPWHILAGLRNTGGADGHGFFWFYFVNEHILRFLGRRIPRDYNKLPALLYWTLHAVWLFPWSLFAPAAVWAWIRQRPTLARTQFARHSALLLTIYCSLVLVFFSLSTNQEYYTFPVYLPLLMLIAAALSRPHQPAPLRRSLGFSYAAFTLLGLAVAAALFYGLWSARHLPYNPDIGSVLAHRDVGDYTLSMSHFFDLTGPSFAALRLPATMALLAFLLGPGIAWGLHLRRRAQPAILVVALTSAVFLIAAHIALVRFAPMLSSRDFAETIQTLEQQRRIEPSSEVLLYGDQAFGSSIPFYLHRQVLLVDGRSTSMLFGSTFPDAPPIFLTPAQLAAQWGHGPRKLLFVPLEQRDTVDRLLGTHTLLLHKASGKALLTDRPLDTPANTAHIDTRSQPTRP